MAKKKAVKPTADNNLDTIENYNKKLGKWIDRSRAHEAETGEKTATTLTQKLLKDLEVSVDAEEEAYAEMLHARTAEQKHEAIVKIADARKRAEEGVVLEASEDDDDALALAKAERLEDDEEDGEEKEAKKPRAKGFLERNYDDAIACYLEKPSENQADHILSLTVQMEVNRRVRFFYDLQKLRVATDLRRQGYDRVFGIKDLFIDHAVEQLKRMEKHNEKMVDRILLRSPDAAFYEYLRDTYTGVGTMMAGCMISEFSAPERFHSVSALWKYCGLAVVGNNPDTGGGGHAQRREKGEKAQWNHFIRTKLLGVLTGCMVKSQTKYVGTPDEKTKGKNVKCLNDYKARQNTINNMIPESRRLYTKSGKEMFKTRSKDAVQAYSKDGKLLGTVRPCDIERKSPGHINNMAKRYMIKMFLCEILNEWRRLKGLEPLMTYDEAKLRGGVKHLGPNLRPLNGGEQRPMM